MARYSVALFTSISTSVEVDVPDDLTDPEQIAELALQQNDVHGLCHQCASPRYGQELIVGDDWEPARFGSEPTITRIS